MALRHTPLGVRCANCHKALAHFFFDDKPVTAHPIRHRESKLINCYPDEWGILSATCRIKDEDWVRILDDLLGLERELR